MTLSINERQLLVTQTQVRINHWIELLLKENLSVKSSKGERDNFRSKDNAILNPPGQIGNKEKLSLTDLIIPLVPKDKLRAFQLTGLKTIEDLLRFSPKWAINRNSFTPISQCINREEPYFILGRINGISEVVGENWKL